MLRQCQPSQTALEGFQLSTRVQPSLKMCCIYAETKSAEHTVRIMPCMSLLDNRLLIHCTLHDQHSSSTPIQYINFTAVVHSTIPVQRIHIPKPADKAPNL